MNQPANSGSPGKLSIEMEYVVCVSFSDEAIIYFIQLINIFILSSL